jgi:hypothetical protein
VVRIEPSRAQCLLDTQKSLSERYLITFCFSRNFRSKKLFAESFGTREARKIEPWYELSFQNVYWAVFSEIICVVDIIKQFRMVIKRNANELFS